MSKPPQPHQNRLIVDDEPATQAVEARDMREGAAVARSEPRKQQETYAHTEEQPRKGKGPYPERRQVTAHIPRQLFLWLKSISAQTDKPMVEIFEDALTAYVNTFAASKKFGA